MACSDVELLSFVEARRQALNKYLVIEQEVSWQTKKELGCSWYGWT